MLEVELKASLEGISPAHIEEKWHSLGFVPATSQQESDTYYSGVDRDFHETDEALRLRRRRLLPDGPSQCLITYKGPKMSRASRTRREYEVAVSDGETAARLMESLGHRPVLTVKKVRRELKKGSVTLCLDEVDGLGRFLELENLVTDGGDRDTAERALLDLLDLLGVSRDRLIRASYLEMLLQKAARAEEK